MKIVEWFIEAVFWLAVFMSPTLAFALAALVVYAKTETIFPFPAVILGAGMICGVICAEWVRKKYGCSNFMSRLYGSGEIQEKEKDIK